MKNKLVIEEAFVSLSLAELLRDRGFDEVVTNHFFNKKPDNSVVLTYRKNSEAHSVEYCSRPTHQFVIDWLIDKHKISLEVRAVFNIHYNRETGEKEMRHAGWEYSIIFLDTGEEELGSGLFDSRFKAVEEGLKIIVNRYIYDQ